MKNSKPNNDTYNEVLDILFDLDLDDRHPHFEALLREGIHMKELGYSYFTIEDSLREKLVQFNILGS